MGEKSISKCLEELSPISSMRSLSLALSTFYYSGKKAMGVDGDYELRARLQEVSRKISERKILYFVGDKKYNSLIS